MKTPNAVCRYLDLLLHIAQNKPIPYVWLDPKYGDVFTYDEAFGTYRDSRGNYLSNLFFERQMLTPNIWFHLEA